MIPERYLSKYAEAQKEENRKFKLRKMELELQKIEEELKAADEVARRKK